ncbi:hypothetical protein HanXRQr2_Chr15g0675581 [Helianthus annuus]|uniref:Uncharacterized protein n=1 Tax=Helianthus annuus TaxID=4232 RepID=A0A9K3H0W5_HELAN|nr:hypothetical protein HanXRQr2_Chr15g0675581 [Helianthus annuus]KAJ0829826.1 hypothetical protein HanPSC8_Chr15g0648211 [Helianthus annuus]
MKEDGVFANLIPFRHLLHLRNRRQNRQASPCVKQYSRRKSQVSNLRCLIQLFQRCNLMAKMKPSPQLNLNLEVAFEFGGYKWFIEDKNSSS